MIKFNLKIINKISNNNISSSFGYYGTSPESPDNNKIVYTKFINNPKTAYYDYPGELFICNTDLTNHEKITDIIKTGFHNSSRPIWINNNLVAYSDSNKYTYIADINTKKIKWGPIGKGMLQHNVYDNKILITVAGNDSDLGKKGLYSFEAVTGKTNLIIENSAFFIFSKNINNPKPDENWKLHHAQWSPDGSKIAVVIRYAGDDEYLASFDSDGLNIIFFGPKPLHWQWYDNETIFGHDVLSDPANKQFRFIKQWNVNGNIIKTLAGYGDHCAMSPDRKWFATETSNKDSIILNLYKNGEFESKNILFKSNNINVVESLKAHINPSFSRNGKRVYFNFPVSENISQACYYDISNIIS